jgi:hypothetical protein
MARECGGVAEKFTAQSCQVCKRWMIGSEAEAYRKRLEEHRRTKADPDSWPISCGWQFCDPKWKWGKTYKEIPWNKLKVNAFPEL